MYISAEMHGMETVVIGLQGLGCDNGSDVISRPTWPGTVLVVVPVRIFWELQGVAASVTSPPISPAGVTLASALLHDGMNVYNGAFTTARSDIVPRFRLLQ